MIFDCYLGWEYDTLQKYFVEHPTRIGQELLVSEPYAALYSYTYWLVQVEDPDFERFHKIKVNRQFGWHSKSNLFFRNGKLDCEPTGKVRLLPYDVIIGGMIKEYNQKYSVNPGHIELSEQMIKQTDLVKHRVDYLHKSR